MGMRVCSCCGFPVPPRLIEVRGDEITKQRAVRALVEPGLFNRMKWCRCCERYVWPAAPEEEPVLDAEEELMQSVHRTSERARKLAAECAATQVASLRVGRARLLWFLAALALVIIMIAAGVR